MSNVVTQLVLRSKVKENVAVAPTSVLPSLAKRKMKLKVRGGESVSLHAATEIFISV